jgi:hypothetical protein
MRKLSDCPVWKPMWIVWSVALPAVVVVDLLTSTAWGALCLIPYAALAIQVFIYAMGTE